jgi:hypothetical protein
MNKNNSLSKQVTKIKIGNINSINQCLIALGASRKDIYVRSGASTKIPIGKSHSTIFDRLGTEEIEYMVEQLYRKAIINYHPDKNNGCPICEEHAKQLGQARNRAKKILARHRLE